MAYYSIPEGQAKSLRFECTLGNHYKFWNCWVEGAGSNWKACVRYGKIGSYGVVHRKNFGSLYTARDYLLKKCNEKSSKGYIHTNPTPKKPNEVAAKKPNKVVAAPAPKPAPKPVAKPVPVPEPEPVMAKVGGEFAFLDALDF